MTSLVKLFSYQIELNISTSKTVTKILQRKLYCHFKCSSRRNHKIGGEFRKFCFINTLKLSANVSYFL